MIGKRLSNLISKYYMWEYNIEKKEGALKLNDLDVHFLFKPI